MEITLYKSPKKAFKLILVSSAVVVCALLSLVTFDVPTRAWYPIIGVCGLGYPVAIFHLFDRRPQIVINEIGIFDPRTCKDFINWDVIQRAYVIWGGKSSACSRKELSQNILRPLIVLKRNIAPCQFGSFYYGRLGKPLFCDAKAVDFTGTVIGIGAGDFCV